MGQIIPLPRPGAAYPSTTEALDNAEATFLMSLRWWVADHRLGFDPLPRLCQAMDMAGAEDAAFPVDRLMGVVARTARRPVEIGCPRCPRVSADEGALLHAASAAQDGDGVLAERVLRTALLSAPGAEFALGPLELVGEVFAAVRLLFTRRAEEIEAWSPAAPLGALH